MGAIASNSMPVRVAVLIATDVIQCRTLAVIYSEYHSMLELLHELKLGSKLHQI